MKRPRPVEPRYLHMVGLRAIDIPPENRHGWLNRAMALRRWLKHLPKEGAMRNIVMMQHRLALKSSR